MWTLLILLINLFTDIYIASRNMLHHVMTTIYFYNFLIIRTML